MLKNETLIFFRIISFYIFFDFVKVWHHNFSEMLFQESNVLSGDYKWKTRYGKYQHM